MSDIMASLQKNLSARQRRNVDRIYSRKAIEQAFLETFDIVGGIPRLATWANDPANYKDFLKLLMVLAPKDIATGDLGTVLEYKSNVPPSPLNAPEDASFTVVDS